MENTVVNSREQKLRGTDIITISVSDMTPPEMQAKVMAMIAKETTIPNTDMVQFGNTVFITHIKEGMEKSWGRAFNVDTAKNFVANGFRFFTHLQEMGVKRYVTSYQGDTYDAAVKVWKKRADTQEVEDESDRTEVIMGKAKKKGETVVFIRLGKEPLI